jgi:hypothetical protein
MKIVKKTVTRKIQNRPHLATKDNRRASENYSNGETNKLKAMAAIIAPDLQEN